MPLQNIFAQRAGLGAPAPVMPPNPQMGVARPTGAPQMPGVMPLGAVPHNNVVMANGGRLMQAQAPPAQMPVQPPPIQQQPLPLQAQQPMPQPQQNIAQPQNYLRQRLMNRMY